MTTVEQERQPALRRHQTTLVLVLLIAVIPLQQLVISVTDVPSLRTWATMFVAVVVQAFPFLIGGVLLAAAISTFVSERMMRRIVPRNPVLAVPAAGFAGMALPGCECASVPVGGGLMRSGLAPAAALTFVLASPAVNPVVLVTTAVAFPGEPKMVLARFIASMGVAIGVGWLWMLRGGAVPLRTGRAHDHLTGARAFLASTQHDLIHTGGFLVLGAAIAASVNTFLPAAWLDAIASHFWISILVLAAFAYVVAICSEADAFVAASLSTFSPVAQLVFMVVGPAMDVKLTALHAGQFGREFAVRFVPLVVVVAIVSAVLTGWWLL